MEKTKLEAMLTHLLNEKGPKGGPWISIQVLEFPKFTREDVEFEIFKIRYPVRWWEFWK